MADSANIKLWKISGGVGSVIAGPTGLTTPMGVAVDEYNDKVYVADQGAGQVVAVGLSSGVISPFATIVGATCLAFSQSTVASPGFNSTASPTIIVLYVGLTGGGVDSVTIDALGAAVVATLVSNSAASALSPSMVPSAISLGLNGLLVADAGRNCLRLITVSSGAVSTLAGSCGATAGVLDGSGGGARFNSPSGVVVEQGTGNALVCDSGGYTVRSVTPGGVVTTTAGLAGTAGTTDGVGREARFTAPYDIALDSDGNAYVVDGASALRLLV